MKTVNAVTAVAPFTNGTVRTRAVSSLVLTERDLALLTGLWEFGAMTRDQIHALFFQGSALRRVNRRLKALADAGMIAPVSTSAASLAMYLPTKSGTEEAL